MQQNEGLSKQQQAADRVLNAEQANITENPTRLLESSKHGAQVLSRTALVLFRLANSLHALIDNITDPITSLSIQPVSLHLVLHRADLCPRL